MASDSRSRSRPDGTSKAKTANRERGDDSTVRSSYLELAGEVEESLTTLRKRLRTAIDRVMPVGYGARSLGRALGLERMTAWRCWTIAHVADAAQAIRAMPGVQGWRKMLSQLEQRGAWASDLEAVREAVDEFESLLKARGVDRTMLRTLADGALDSSREAAGIRSSRRLATKAAARLYGLQAKTFLVSHVLSPGSRSGMLSLGIVAITEGLRRLRPGMPWPIVWNSVAIDESDELRRHTPLGDSKKLPNVVEAVSTPGIVGHELKEGFEKGRGRSIELCDVRPENDRGIRICTAENLSGIEVDRDQEFEQVSLHVSFLYPALSAVIEVLVHRDLHRHTEPASALLGSPLGVESMTDWQARTRLPLETSPREAPAGALPKALTELAPAYEEGLRRVIEAQGSGLEDFDLFRLEIPYPPMYATASLAFELAM
ncbi:MAG: hypothetical protein ACYTFH_03570 [Planctomycetota bacterium]